MIRLACAFLAALTWSTGAFAQTQLTGTVSATWKEPTLVTPSEDAIVRPGETVTLSLSGAVDVNIEERSERKCGFLGISCNVNHWTDHNWRNPSNLRVFVQLQPVNGNAAIGGIYVGSSPIPIEAPLVSGLFTNAYRIVAMVEGAGTTIDPSRSAGAFNLQISVNATKRAQYFATWLAQQHPSANDAISASAIDQHTREFGGPVAVALRTFAANASATDKLKLLQAALDLAPGDAETSLALAKYYRTAGLNDDADRALDAAISNLGADPASRLKVGDAYLARVSLVLSQGGAVGAETAKKALAFLDGAILAYKQAGRDDLASAGYVDRGKLLRGMRTREALAEAVASFKLGMAGLPDGVRANDIIASANGSRVFAVNSTPGFSIVSAARGAQAADARTTGEMPVSWDPIEQRLLLRTSSGVTKLPLSLNDPVVVYDGGQGDRVVGGAASGGAVLWIVDQARAKYISSTGYGFDLPVAGPNNTSCGTPARPTSSPFAQGQLGNINGFSLSLDGNTAALACMNVVRVFRWTGSNVVQVAERTLQNSAAVYAGPDSCGTVIAAEPAQDGAPYRLTLIRASGSDIKLADYARPADASDLAGAPFGERGILINNTHVFVVWAPGVIRVFRCSDGTREPDITIPGAGATIPAQRDTVHLQWLSSDQFAVSRETEHDLNVVSLPTRAVRRVSMSPSLDTNDRDALLEMPLAAANSSTDISFAHDFYSSEFVEAAKPNAPLRSIEVPGWVERSAITSDGAHILLSSDAGALLSINMAGSGGFEATPTGETFVDVLSDSPGWLAAKYDDQRRLIQFVVRPTTGAAKAFVSTPSTIKTLAIAEAQRILAKANSSPPTVNTNVLKASEIQALITNPDLFDFGVGARFTDRGGSITGLSGRAAAIVCVSVRGRSSPTASPKSLGELVELNFLVVEDNAQISFRQIPKATRGNSTIACRDFRLARGQRPTVYYTSSTGVSYLSANGWVAATLQNAGVAAAWVPANGSILFLHSVVPPSGSNDAYYTLVQAKSDGSLSLACPGLCNSINLTSAAKAVLQTAPTMSPDLSVSNPTSMVRIDPDGKLFARVDGKEIVVVSLATGAVLKRLPIGMPVFLDARRIGIASTSGQVLFYPLLPG